MTAPIPPGPCRIWCCICLNLDNRTASDATTVVAGYAVCPQHVEILTGEHTDFAGLIRRLKARTEGGPT